MARKRSKKTPPQSKRLEDVLTELSEFRDIFNNHADVLTELQKEGKQFKKTLNNIEISIKAFRNILINKKIATEKEINDEWKKLWDEKYKKKKEKKKGDKKKEE